MKTFLALVAASFCLTGFAQQKTTNDNLLMKEVDGYIIRTFKAGAGTYGFEIMRGSERLHIQRRNPYTGSQFGLKNRGDAMKTANYLVTTVMKKQKQLPEGKKLPERVMLSMPLSTEVARQLQVDIK